MALPGRLDGVVCGVWRPGPGRRGPVHVLVGVLGVCGGRALPPSHATIHLLVRSPLLGQLLSLPLLLMTLTVVRGTGQIFCKLCLYWNLSDAFLTIRLRL